MSSVVPHYSQETRQTIPDTAAVRRLCKYEDSALDPSTNIVIVDSNSPAASVTNLRSKASSACTKITTRTSFSEALPRAESLSLR